MKIGNYEVLRELGRGGMGSVYLARSTGAGGIERLVAIKRPHEGIAESKETTARFLDEARIAAQVHHANVVGMHQVGVDDGGYYLVFDYVEGASLVELLDLAAARGERLPLTILLRVTMDALAGLHAAHETRDSAGNALCILHRDVSPQNLLVGRDGVTRLTDFGIAKSNTSSVVTDQRYLRGKLVYMSPEYLQRLPVDRTMDSYAMGVTLWTALNAAPPWAGFDEAQLVQAILLDGVPELEVPWLPESLVRVVAKACNQDAGMRFQTARQMLDALEAVRVEIGLPASHLDVAEYVEGIAGTDLDSRRQALIKPASRAAPAASELPDTPAVAPEPRHTTELHWQREEPPAPTKRLETTAFHRAWEGRSPWWTLGYVGLALLILVIGFVFVSAKKGTPEPTTGANSVDRGAPARAAESVAPAARPPPEPPPSAFPANEAHDSAESAAPAMSAVAPSPKAAPATRPRKRVATPPGNKGYPPFSPQNPYR
jgi:serine/threonine-protein kinase